MTPTSTTKTFGGTQAVYTHRSDACDCDMNVAVFTPEGAENAPALIWLSGLTCTEQNFITKAGAQRIAAQLGMILIAPDTSPRGDDVTDDEAYDFGKGAGFYLDATEQPWAKHFQMESYIRHDLTEWIGDHLPVDMSRLGIFGHSMGGHGALTLHLKYPDIFKTCSAFSPIVNPIAVPWGQKALRGYLGDTSALWERHDACALVKKDSSGAHILIDQGTDDQFLAEQLKPHLFKDACEIGGQEITLRMQPGYDHSYYFIASFIEDHLRHHAAAL